MNHDRKNGDPPKIICLPGWMNKAEVLRPLAELVGADFQLLDFPDNVVRSVPDFADWVASQIDYPVYLAGHSFGGKVAIAVAALHPEKVKGIFVIAGSNMGRLIFRLLRPAVKLAKFLGFSGKRFRAADYEGSSPVMRENMKRTLDFDIAPLARRIKCPAVFVYGVNDATTPPALGRKLSAAARGQFFVLKGFDHHTIITDGTYQVGAIIRNNVSRA